MEDEVKLDPPAASEPSAPPAELSTAKTEDAKAETPAESTAGQTAADVPLAPEAAKSAAGEIVQDGLVFQIDGDEAALVGWRASSLEGDVSVPALVSSGADSYAVTRVGLPDADKGVLTGSSVTSVSLPASIETIEDGALAGCPSLSRISVSSKNESFASFDGMLFSKDLASLLLVPEGKEGAARIPDQTNAVPASVFSHCARLSCILVGEGSRSLASWNGLLFTNDMKTLVACPPGAGDAVVIPEDVESIDAGAFAGCAVSSITALGFVREIAADAFDAEARGSAVVALPAGDDYEARKAVWKAAGFENFVEPARPGDVSTPEPSEPDAPQASGLAYEVLDDYTLAVSWQGAEGPEGDLDIPATAEVGGVSFRVSAVADAGFAGRTGLTGVALPASIVAIGDRAFEATGISDVWLPASVATVGERALAACPSLSRVVALGSPWVADRALSECSGVSVYAPPDSANPWNVGLPAAGNHLMPYGAQLLEEPLQLEVGQSASLLESGDLQAPEPIEVSYAYAAKPLSVEPDGTATGKAEGSSEVAVTLALDGVELASASRTVEIAPAPAPEPEPEAEAPATEGDPDDAPASFEQTTLEAELSTEGVRGFAMLSDAAPVAEIAALETGQSFELEVPSGQTLKFAVLADDGSGTPKVSVSKSADTAKKPEGALTIPASVQHDGVTYVVTAIPDQAFASANAVTAITFEEGSAIQTIGYRAFVGCSACVVIVLPDSVRTIGNEAFAYCTMVKRVSIPDSVESLGQGVFLDCTSLETVELGSSVSAIAVSTFGTCAALKTMRFRGVVASIDQSAFSGSSVDEVVAYVPNDHGKQALEDASERAGFAFKEIRVEGELCTVTFDSQGGVPAVQAIQIEKGALVAEPSVAGKPGSSVAGWFTDPACEESTRWDFAEPVQTDKTLYAKWVGVAQDGDLTYELRSDGASLAVSATNPSLLAGAITIPETHTFGELQEELPVKEVAVSGFARSSIESVRIPSSVEVVGGDAFRWCGSLREVEIEAGSVLRVLGGNAFNACSSLVDVVLPSTLESMGRSVFENCTSLESVDFGDNTSMRALPTSAFYHCGKLSSIVLPDSVASIGSYAFEQAKQLETVTMPQNIQFIGGGAFVGCSSLHAVDLHAIEVIGYRAFSKSGLRTVEVPSSLKRASAGVFAECPELMSATIKSDAMVKMSESFAACPKLENVSLPATAQTFSSSAFYNSPSIKVVYAAGSMSGSNVASVFTAATKQNATVVLPSTAQDGSGDDFAAMAAVWKSTHGFANVIASHGALPTETNAGNTDESIAGWSLDADGLLSVWSTESVADFKWVWNEGEFKNQHWGPVRGFVKSADTMRLAGARGMDCWFREMPNLTDITKVIIPSNAETLADMFTYAPITEIPSNIIVPAGAKSIHAMFNCCRNLTAVPDWFEIPEGVQDIGYLFGTNPNMTDLPATFKIPKSVTAVDGFFNGWTSMTEVPASFVLPENGVIENARCLFSDCPNLKALPEGFTLPDTVTISDCMFRNCSSLVSLPEGLAVSSGTSFLQMFMGCTSLVSIPDSFTLPSELESAVQMFSGCTSLASLPDGFALPDSVGSKVGDAFKDCTSLVRLPSGFTLPAAAKANATVFQVEGANLPMLYGGSDPDVIGYAWDKANRTLVKPADKPANAKTVTLNVKAEGESGPGSYWTTAYTDGSGVLAEPAYAPSRPGMVFALWYADPECTQRVDFSQPFAEDATLYGKLAPGTRGGSLPTETGTGTAYWSLSDDGTLYIRGAGKISDLGWPSVDIDDTVRESGYWAPYRLDVRKAVMRPGLQAVTTSEWFAGMENMVDAEQTFIPEGVGEVVKMFFKCSSLASLPDGFKLPESVWKFGRMFGDCASLEKLPDGFNLPEGARDANAMFLRSGIAVLPEGFALPAGMKSARFMFFQCANLAALPPSFVLSPQATVDLNSAFAHCTSLSSLPEGLAIPSTLESVNGEAYSPLQSTFLNCVSLTVLPSSLDVPSAFLDRTFFCEIGEGSPRVPVFYDGASEALLNYDWASQNRVLIADPADRDLHEVAFKLVNEDGTWSTRTTALTGSDGMVPNPGNLQREGYGFTGWYVDEDCLVPFDFGEPVDEDRTLYGKWIKHGGRDAKLPLIAGSQGDVWWRITVDGQLCIGGEGQVDDLGFSFDQSKERVNYWDPFRTEINDIVMEPGVTVPSGKGMNAWFCWLPNLQTVDSLVVPEGTRSMQDMFHGCKNLKSLHEGFAVPSSVESIVGLFNSCLSLESLPQSFTLKEGNLKLVRWAFNTCTALKALPAGFTIPYGVTEMEYFARGSALESLPEGFDIPETVTSAGYAFEGIPTLRAFPESLNLSKLSAAAKGTMSTAFACSALTETYYPGDPANLAMGEGYWTAQNRTIVSAAPAGKTFVDLYLPDEAGAQKLWTRKALDASSSLSEPVAPGWEDHAFLGWYTDPDCTAKATFPLTLSGETSLYGKYALSGGKLPTVRDGVEGEEASWSFEDGTLTIRCDVEGAAIDTLWQMPEDGNVNSFPRTKHWSPLRDQVTKVVIDTNVRVCRDIRFWFASMGNLTDITEFHFPEGTADATHLFAKCLNLAYVPNDFTIPDYVTSLNGLFLNCAVESLPAGLTLPEKVKDVASMLDGCKIASIPNGFVLPPTVEKTSFMLSRTPIEELPPSFLLPDGVEKAQSMFASCSKLKTLPDGFKIPKGMVIADRMFRGCSSLVALPDGFDFEDPALLVDVSEMFGECYSLKILPNSLSITGIPSTCAGLDTMFKAAAGPLSTYVVGGDLTKLAVLGNDATSYWSEKYNRKLVTDVADLGGAKPVTFKTKVAGEQEWTTWQTMLTDASGVLADPQYAGRFGYAFDGWYTDINCTQKFVFGETPLPAEGVLYGTHSLIVKYEIPIEAQVTLNALGEVAPADVRMKSFTPVPLAITQVKCTPVNSSSDIMDPADLVTAAVTLLPQGAKRPLFVEVGETAGTSSQAFSIPEAKPGAPGVFNYAIGLDIPDVSKVKLWRDGWSTDLVTLEYTVAPA